MSLNLEDKVRITSHVDQAEPISDWKPQREVQSVAIKHIPCTGIHCNHCEIARCTFPTRLSSSTIYKTSLNDALTLLVRWKDSNLGCWGLLNTTSKRRRTIKTYGRVNVSAKEWYQSNRLRTVDSDISCTTSVNIHPWMAADWLTIVNVVQRCVRIVVVIDDEGTTNTVTILCFWYQVRFVVF